MKIEYKVLCSEGNKQRIDNVSIMKEQIPSLQITMSGLDGLFERFINLFNLEHDSTGLVQLEDDVQLCKNFQNRCESLISRRSHEVISMFESACQKKGELHSEYRPGRVFAWNQCNYYPKEVCVELAKQENVEEFKEWYWKHYSTWTFPEDTYIAFVLRKLNLKYWMQVPFLVQHLDFKSALGPRPTNRQTKYFIDDLEGNND